MSSAAGSPLRALLWIAALLVVLCVTAWGRALHETGHYAKLGDIALAEERLPDAIIHYRHSAQWLAPLSSRPRRSVDALVGIGDAAAEQGDDLTALTAWRSARIAILSTRWLLTPHAEVLDDVHPKIAAAMARQADGGADAAATYHAQLDGWSEREPNRLLTLLASFAFLGWMVTLVGAAWQGFDPEGKVQKMALARWAGASTLLAAIWMVATRFA